MRDGDECPISILSPLAQGDQVDVDCAGAEAGFAVAEVEFPEPPEGFVEAQRRDLRPALLEAAAPIIQRQGVALAEIELVGNLEPDVAGAAPERRHRWQAAAWEDVALDEVRALLVALEQGFIDGDRLQHGAPAGAQRAAQRLEI